MMNISELEARQPMCRCIATINSQVKILMSVILHFGILLLAVFPCRLRQRITSWAAVTLSISRCTTIRS